MKLSKILFAALAVLGVQNTFATCEGTLYFKIPENWLGHFYVLTTDTGVEVVSRYDAATGYFKADLGWIP